MWILPVMDRTLSDALHAKETPNVPERLKGARNYTDLLRITGNMRYLRGLLMAQGYGVPELESRENWADGDIPRRSDILMIKKDVSELRNMGFVLSDTPPVPDLPYLHYQKLNDVERILFDINETIKRVEEDFLYCGEFYAGGSRDDQHFDDQQFEEVLG